MIDIFTNTVLGKKLTIDCIDIIQLKYKLIEYKNVCSFCKSYDVSYWDYIDGTGYICPKCLYK